MRVDRFNKKPNEHFKKTYMKYLISYAGILIIPTVIVAFFINTILLSTLREQITQHNMDNLMQIQYIIDTNIEQLDQIIIDLSLNDQLMIQSDLHDIQEAKKLMKQLNVYELSNKFIYKLFFYIDGDNFLYSSTSSYTFDHLLTTSFYLPDEQSEYLNEIIKSCSVQAIVPSQITDYNCTKKNVIFYVVPLKLYPYDVPVSVVFMLDDTHMQTLMSADSSSKKQTFSIYDQNGQLISTTASNTIMHVPLDTFDFSNSSQDYQELAIDDSRQALSAIHSPRTGWTYVSSASLTNTYALVNNLNRAFILIMVFILFIGILWIIVSMKVNYGSLQRLRQHIRKLNPTADIYNNDAMDDIRLTLDYLATENSSLRMETEEFEKYQIKYNLLTGSFNNIDDYNLIARKYLLNFTKELFIVYVIQFNYSYADNVNIYDLEMIQNDYYNGFLQATIDPCRYVYIANLDKKTQTTFNDHMKSLREDMSTLSSDVNVIIGIGDFYTDIIDIPRSYRDAIIALDYSLISPIKKIFYKKDYIGDQLTLTKYPHNLFESFRFAVKEQKVSQINVALMDIIHYINTSNCPLFYTRTIAFEVISALSNNVSKHTAESLEVHITALYSKIIGDFSSSKELVEILQDLSITLSNFVNQQKDTNQKNRIQSIMREIKDKCFDSSFSIQDIADNHQLTSANFSQYFKSQNGLTPIEYVTSLRMEKAILLLEEDKLTLDEIANTIGYLNTSSFIRRFKQLYGLTPRKYAKEKKQK